jgi:catechol 2,3-dioxygenase-like lactoylglutathione lyase family enzyme
MIRGIHHVAINTANLERIVDFYVNVLGCERVRDDPGPGWRDNPVIDAVIGLRGSAARGTMLRAGNVHIEVFEYSAPAARDGGPLRPCDRGYTHIALDVVDIEAEYARLKAAGMAFVHDGPVDLGNLKAVYGSDPDGNIIEILETAPGHEFSIARLPGFAADPSRT